MRALIITATSELRWTDLTELEDFQGAVGGYIEHIRLNDDSSMFVDEDGKRKRLPANPIATGVVRIYSMLAGALIVGDAVIVGSSNGTPVNTSLEDDAQSLTVVREIAAAFGGVWLD